MTWLTTLAALVNGVFTPVQSGCNARLAGAAGHPILAAVTNTAVGTVTLTLLAVALRLGTPNGAAMAGAPWWAWVGGVLGSLYVAVNLYLAPKLGASTLISLVVCGQLLTSLTLDHFGWAGYERHPVNVGRVAGAVLMIAGVALLRRF